MALKLVLGMSLFFPNWWQLICTIIIFILKIYKSILFSKRKIILLVTNLKGIILRTFGALGMVINKEFAKKVMRRRASKFWGTFMADSLTVNSK